MKAYVCDKCGKVILLEDERPYMMPSGVYQLIGDTDKMHLDLCEECANELVEAVRRAKEDTDG